MNANVTFSINQSQANTSISPLIYGINTDNSGGVANPGLNQSAYQNLNLTFERVGGNRWTAYNWNNNASNAGSDYLYENDNYLGGGSTPGGAVIPFLQGAGSSAGAIVTVPIAGYVAADFAGPQNPAILPQNSTHFVPEYPTVAQDPAPAANHVYQNGFVQLVKNNFTSSGPLVFDLDNEPDLWSSTHQEVHPAATTYAELISRSVSYATMIKSVAPNALVFGPASYGWNGYINLQNAPDSAANGDFLNYYLKQMSAASTTAGVRLLDALDLHWYPEATGLNASGQATRITGTDTSPGVVAARLQAPRSLWDSTYTETSWITQDSTHGPIDLIPLENGKIAANYPGTKLSFGEYNYGGGQDISGGIAEADVLGIFGKLGVYSANEWPLSGSESFIAGAFQIFRNYDGHNATFGNTAVQAINSDTVNSSVYASIDSNNPDHMTLVVINKQSTATTATINLANGGIYKTAAVYQLTSANSTPQAAAAINVNGATSFNYSMPAYSVTTLSLLSNQWFLSTGGSWASAASWSGTIPNAQAAVANFLAAPTGLATPGVVTLDGNKTVGQILFNDANAYTISPGTGGTLTIDDTGDTSGAGPSITVVTGNHFIKTPITLANGVGISIATGQSLSINGNIAGIGQLTKTGAGRLSLNGSGSFGNTLVSAGTLNIGQAGSLPPAATLSTSATVNFAAGTGSGILTRSLAAMNIYAGGVVTIANPSSQAGRTLFVLSSLSFVGSANAWSGQLDLTANDMFVHGGNLTTLTNQIQAGYNHSSWTGQGIISSAAGADSTGLTTLGILTNDDGSGHVLFSTFDGQSAVASDVLVKYTYEGDATLDGHIDGSDYTRIDNGYNNHLTGWANGDFNYDGTVNGSDYTLIDNAFNNQGAGLNASPLNIPAAPPGQSSGTTPVPEPATLGFLIFIGALSPLQRPKRQPQHRWGCLSNPANQ